jgi:purine-nucleoside phosphorylase
MTTPHISAEKGDFADVVLLPGDPLRAKYIAENHLTDARQVTEVRNMLGFTGSYQGRPVSVMGSGMGIPSSSIYATELVQQLGVSQLIRVGSCGSLQKHVAMRDIVIGFGAGTDSMVNRRRFGGYDFPATADFAMTRAAVESAERLGIPVHVGNIFSSDLFYAPTEDNDDFAMMARLGILAVEMEAAGLYGIAAQYGARALTVLTVSDHLLTDEKLSPEDRQTSFDDMIRMTLGSLAT